jgi:hypothetical protein
VNCEKWEISGKRDSEREAEGNVAMGDKRRFFVDIYVHAQVSKDRDWRNVGERMRND